LKYNISKYKIVSLIANELPLQS